jgi:hypothetical protein
MERSPVAATSLRALKRAGTKTKTPGPEPGGRSLQAMNLLSGYWTTMLSIAGVPMPVSTELSLHMVMRYQKKVLPAPEL